MTTGIPLINPISPSPIEATSASDSLAAVIIDASMQEFLDEQAAEIRTRSRKTLENTLVIGEVLCRVKECIRGGFGTWIREEFDWSQDTAENYMRLARWVESLPAPNRSELGCFTQSALYQLAAPSTPSEVQADLFAAARAGLWITRERVRQSILALKADHLASMPAMSMPTPTTKPGDPSMLPDASMVNDPTVLGDDVTLAGVSTINDPPMLTDANALNDAAMPAEQPTASSGMSTINASAMLADGVTVLAPSSVNDATIPAASTVNDATKPAASTVNDATIPILTAWQAGHPWQLLYGDCRAMLATMPAAWVQTVVTSPPYWGGIRNYGIAPVVWGGSSSCAHEWIREIVRGRDVRHGLGSSSLGDGTRATENLRDAARGGTVPEQSRCCLCAAVRCCLGQEAVPDCGASWTPHRCGSCYVCHMLEVFRAVRRVLRSDGVVFLNLGDTYATGSPPAPDAQELQGCIPPLKKKDLGLTPFRVAIALQADGWYVRSVMPWIKSNPMPGSWEDRPVFGHEYILVLTKQPAYTFDGVAVRQPWADDRQGRDGGRPGRVGGRLDAVQLPGGVDPSGNGGRNWRTTDPWYDRAVAAVAALQSILTDGGLLCDEDVPVVLHTAVSNYGGAHFATFPKRLAHTCIQAGAPPYVCCTCGQAWERVVQEVQIPDRSTGATAGRGAGLERGTPSGGAHREGRQWQRVVESHTTGWVARCACGTGARSPVVLDLFNGAGTTGCAAITLGRDYVGIDSSRDYLEQSNERMAGFVAAQAGDESTTSLVDTSIEAA